MLSLVRTTARRINRVSARSFAEIVEQNTPSTSSNIVSTNGHSNPFQRIPVREDHGLYAFFRRKSGDDLVGDARFETFESPDSGQVMTGKVSWRFMTRLFLKILVRKGLEGFRTTIKKF